MQISETVDCNGLSPAPTVLRIKQALIGRDEDRLPLEILVGSDCDREQLMSCLGKDAGDVRFVAHPA
ncbi:hypothetical protein FMN50_07335 [Rhodobacterales bacterium]|nr:hypothetical protein FMN50_07335 [Rhodobacterales bacterium]